jgi:hypothetical protein
VRIDEDMKSAFIVSEDLKYDFDVHEPMHDKSDLWLQNKPIGTKMEVELRFSGEVISNNLAEKALHLFCDIVQMSSAAVSKPLGPFSLLTYYQVCPFLCQYILLAAC